MTTDGRDEFSTDLASLVTDRGIPLRVKIRQTVVRLRINPRRLARQQATRELNRRLNANRGID